MKTDKQTLDNLFEEKKNVQEHMSNVKKLVETAKELSSNIDKQIALAAEPYILEVLTTHNKRKCYPFMTSGAIYDEVKRKEHQFEYQHICDALLQLLDIEKIEVGSVGPLIDGYVCVEMGEFRLKEDKND